MPRALLLVAGVVLLAGGLFVAAFQRASAGAPAGRTPDATLRDQFRAVSVENQRLREEVARVSAELERLRSGPPAPTHQRIHDTLLPALAEGREELAEPALMLLSGIDPLDRPCAEALLEALRSSSQGRVRILAAQALSMRRDRFPDLDRASVADGLVDAARLDKVGEVRIAALTALEGCDPPEEDLEILLDIAASDAREDVRAGAARALAGARPAARGPFLARLERIFETERSRTVRRELVNAAARAGGEASRPTLERLRKLAPDLSGEIDGALTGLPAVPK
ncbi:MAG: HEAT repeat domain-containing protein [Planctomycetota bacterium]